jgi:predicted hotdog family 3-hydroxylacyl-ACP dehydratase
MLLVEGVIEVVLDGIVCRGSIPLSHPMVEDGKAPTVLGIELGAQAAAVLEGLSRSKAVGEPAAPQLGFLVGIRNAKFHVPQLRAAFPLRTRVKALGGAGSLAMYAVSVSGEESPEEYANGTISTFAIGQSG